MERREGGTELGQPAASSYWSESQRKERGVGGVTGSASKESGLWALRTEIESERASKRKIQDTARHAGQSSWWTDVAVTGSGRPGMGDSPHLRQYPVDPTY